MRNKPASKTIEREESGLLHRGGPWLFLQNAAGHHWRLDVDERRASPLIGLRVRVKGRAARGTIKVKSIVQD